MTIWSILVLLLCILGSKGRKASSKLSAIEEYWNIRRKLIQDETFLSIGGNLTLSDGEVFVNNVLMAAKQKELEEAIQNPKTFLPAQNFIQARNEISKSQVFQIIQKIPKGSALHVHDKAMTSIEFLFRNITFHPHLFVCDKNGVYSFRFFHSPKNDCDWRNLRTLRKSKDKLAALNTKIYQQLNMLTNHPNVEYADVDKTWDKFHLVVETLGPLLTYRPVFEKYVYQGLQELYDDNIIYAEIRAPLSSLYELNGTKHGVAKVVDIYQGIIDRFKKSHPDFVGIKLIYSRRRKMTSEQLKENIKTVQRLKRAYPKLIAGFDITGLDDKEDPLANFVNELKTADIDLFFHAGKNNWITDENLIDAVLLNVKRIGYDFALLKHPKVMEQIHQRKIAIEVNPISNQVLKVTTDDMRKHPASVLFAKNLPIVVSNDHPTVWGAKGLSYDFYEAFMGMMAHDADLRSLKMLALNSIAYSSMDSEEMAKASAIFKKQWERFVENFDID